MQQKINSKVVKNENRLLGEVVESPSNRSFEEQVKQTSNKSRISTVSTGQKTKMNEIKIRMEKTLKLRLYSTDQRFWNIIFNFSVSFKELVLKESCLDLCLLSRVQLKNPKTTTQQKTTTQHDLKRKSIAFFRQIIHLLICIKVYNYKY